MRYNVHLPLLDETYTGIFEIFVYIVSVVDLCYYTSMRFRCPYPL